MPGASFNCIFCKIRKQWISKSIQEVTKALVTIIFTIIFPYAICSVELLIWQHCEDGERIVRAKPLWQWVVWRLLCICKCKLTAARGKAAPSKCLRPAHTDSQQQRNSEEDFSLGGWAVKSEDGEEAFRLGWIKAIFFYFTEKQENLGFGQPLNIYFCIIKLPHIFKLRNHLKNGSPNLLV